MGEGTLELFSGMGPYRSVGRGESPPTPPPTMHQAADRVDIGSVSDGPFEMDQPLGCPSLDVPLTKPRYVLGLPTSSYLMAGWQVLM